MLNVNLPAGVTADTPSSLTRVGRSRYLECFQRITPTAAAEEEEVEMELARAAEKESAAAAGAEAGVNGGGGEVVARFKHAPSGMSWEDDKEGSDTYVVKIGRISVTPVTLQGVCGTSGTGGGGGAGDGDGALDLSWLGCGVGETEPVGAGAA